MIDFETLAPPSRPNWWLLAPEGLCRAATPTLIAPVFAAPPQTLADVVKGAILADPRTRLVEDDAERLRFAFTATSRVLRFVDDIDVAILPQGAGSSTLALYSRSRVGYSDLGVNAARGQRILARITERLTKAA